MFDILGHISTGASGQISWVPNILARDIGAIISLNIVSRYKLKKTPVAYFMVAKLQFLTQLIAFALHLSFIFSTFSVYLWRAVWSTPVSVQFFLTRSQINVLWIVCVVNYCTFTWFHLFLTWLHWYFVC